VPLVTKQYNLVPVKGLIAVQLGSPKKGDKHPTYTLHGVWHSSLTLSRKTEKNRHLFLLHHFSFSLYYLATCRNMLCQFHLGKVATTDGSYKAILANMLQVFWWSCTFCTAMGCILNCCLFNTIAHHTDDTIKNFRWKMTEK